MVSSEKLYSRNAKKRFSSSDLVLSVCYSLVTCFLRESETDWTKGQKLEGSARGGGGEGGRCWAEFWGWTLKNLGPAKISVALFCQIHSVAYVYCQFMYVYVMWKRHYISPIFVNTSAWKSKIIYKNPRKNQHNDVGFPSVFALHLFLTQTYLFSGVKKGYEGGQWYNKLFFSENLPHILLNPRTALHIEVIKHQYVSIQHSFHTKRKL